MVERDLGQHAACGEIATELEARQKSGQRRCVAQRRPGRLERRPSLEAAAAGDGRSRQRQAAAGAGSCIGREITATARAEIAPALARLAAEQTTRLQQGEAQPLPPAVNRRTRFQVDSLRRGRDTRARI